MNTYATQVHPPDNTHPEWWIIIHTQYGADVWLVSGTHDAFIYISNHAQELSKSGHLDMVNAICRKQSKTIVNIVGLQSLIVLLTCIICHLAYENLVCLSGFHLSRRWYNYINAIYLDCSPLQFHDLVIIHTIISNNVLVQLYSEFRVPSTNKNLLNL